MVRLSASAVLVLSLVGYPLAAALAEYLQVSNRWVSVPFRALVLALSMLVLMACAGRARKASTQFFWMAFWAFWILYVSRMILDYFLNDEALKLPFWEYIFYGLGVSLIPAAAVSRGNDHTTSSGTAWSIILVGSAGLALNLALIFGQSDLQRMLDFLGNRVETEALNPISIGHLGVTVLILSSWVLLSRRPLGLLPAIVLLGCCILGLVGLIASASRGPALSLAIVAVLMACTMGWRGVAFGAAGMLVVVAALYVFGTLDAESVFFLDRLRGGELFADSARSSLLQEAFEVIRTNPLGGGGTEPLPTYPHNFLIEGFLIAGLVTGLLFGFLYFHSLWAGLRLVTARSPSAWVAFLLFQYASAAMFSGSIYFSAAWWVLAALVVSEYAGLDSSPARRAPPASVAANN